MSRKRPGREEDVCEGGFRRSTMYLLALVSADVNAELEELAMDARRTPKRVVAAHLANQFAYFLRHGRATGLAAPDLPSPEQSESFAVPSYDGCRFDDAQSRGPFGPGSTKPRREARISSCNAARVRKTDRVDASNADNTAVGGN